MSKAAARERSTPLRTVDLIISGGTVIDGTGAPGVAADIGVTGERITAIAAPGTLSGHTVLDVSGQVVSPGFIDLHSHADFTVAGHPDAETVVTQGVTTLLTGNCGWSPFPLTDAASLAHATAIFDPELAWSWSDAAGYADAIDATEPAVNIALQVGHSALRIAVLGTDERPPQPAELQQMQSLLDEAAEQGVHGFSTGLIYAPGCYASPSEVTTLARVAARHDLLYSTHMRNETAQLLTAVTEALDTAASSSVRLEISHLKAMGQVNHGTVSDALRLLDKAAADGLDVACDVYPYTASSTTLTSRLPGWALDGGADALLQRLGDPATRARIATDLRKRMGRDVDPLGVIVAGLPPGSDDDVVGRSLSEIAETQGTDPAEAALRLLAEHQAAVAIVNHAMAEEDVTTVMRHPLASIASDGWTMRATGSGRPHPRSFGSFTRVLGRYVRKQGDLELSEAIRKMTSLPASRAHLTDRGVLRVGAVADIAVFDPAHVVDRSTFENPWQLSTGVSHVLLGGQPVLADGVPTGRRPGRVLRRT